VVQLRPGGGRQALHQALVALQIDREAPAVGIEFGVPRGRLEIHGLGELDAHLLLLRGRGGGTQHECDPE
jgi:hypothetical protein